MFAFNFADDAYGNCEGVVASDGTLCPSTVYSGVFLTKEQARRAAAIVNGALKGWSGDRTAPLCFNPHHAVVFFDDHDVPVAEVTVCFGCGDLRVQPGPTFYVGMTDAEADFFAETCRALRVGGCPPPGSSQMPATARSPAEVAIERGPRGRPADREPGIPWERPLAGMSRVERKVLRAWLDSVTRVWAPFQSFTCADGRRFVNSAHDPKGRDPQDCDATVGDFIDCIRRRVDSLCKPYDGPTCAKVDPCRWGIYLDEGDAGPSP
jgi:hypothetical protein